MSCVCVCRLLFFFIKRFILFFDFAKINYEIHFLHFPFPSSIHSFINLIKKFDDCLYALANHFKLFIIYECSLSFIENFHKFLQKKKNPKRKREERREKISKLIN